MKVKNNILWKAIHKKFPSVAAFCRTHEELKNKLSAICGLICFSNSPFDGHSLRKGNKEYRSVCLDLERILAVPAEELFPEWLYQKMVGQPTSKAIEVSSFTALPNLEKKKLLALPARDNVIEEVGMRELGEKIQSVLQKLTYRQREIIKLRYGLFGGGTHTLEEIGRIFDISKERVRLIEAEAVRKLQHPVRSNCLRSFVEIE